MVGGFATALRLGRAVVLRGGQVVSVTVGLGRIAGVVDSDRADCGDI